MRLWDYRLLPYLPDAQFKGQLRDLVLIMRTWRDIGKTNHLLINKVMEYDKKHLTSYFLRYYEEYRNRYHKKIDMGVVWEFLIFANYEIEKDYKISFENSADIISIRILTDIFAGWNNKEYLRVCVCNLYEKYHFGVGKSKITQTEWDRILQGYKEITGEEYKL